MTKARILADFISDGSSLADGTISVAEVSGAAPLASPTFTGGIDVTGTVVADGNLTLGSSTNAYTLARLDHENVGGKAEIQLNAYGSASFSMLSNFTGSTLDGVATGNFGLITPHNAGISINTSGLERMKIDGSGNTVFNEGGVDADFRVESDANAHALFVDGGANVIGMGTSIPSTYVGGGGLSVKGSTNSDLALVSSSVSVGDNSHQLRFYNEAGASYEIARMRVNVGAGQVNRGEMQFANNNGATLRPWLDVDYGNNVVFNAQSYDADFRVVSDTNTHMLFVDASVDRVGVGATPMTNGSTFQVTSDSTESTNMQLTLRGASDTNKQMIMGFDTTANTAHITTQIAGSAPTPLIFKTGNVVFNEASSDSDFRVESDGNSHMLFVDAGYNAVGIANAAPRAPLDIRSTIGAHALVAGFIRATSNDAVDILTVSGQPSNCGVAIYARLVAASAVTNEAAVIEFWAALNRQSGGADTATAITPVVSKAIVGTAIGAGSLAWSGKTLQYTPDCGVNYVGYQMEIQIATNDTTTITIDAVI
jgi:hypothetical protein